MTATTKQIEGLRKMLPDDPITMTDAEIDRLDKQAAKVAVRSAASVISDMRARRDAVESGTGDDGSSWCVGSRWYWSMYLSTPQKRRNHLELSMASSNIG